ncbi:MAG: zinc-binding dehydrogenase [Leptolyngbya sp. SIO1D8]|nr:zinc-binding dehydrogenase [Leptolyngbya sp. SIO1D8]
MENPFHKAFFTPNMIWDGYIIETLKGMLTQWWISKTDSKKISSFLANVNPKDLAFLKGLLESSKVKPVIDRRYPLSEAAEALRYLGEGHAKGKIIIHTGHNLTSRCSRLGSADISVSI